MMIKDYKKQLKKYASASWKIGDTLVDDFDIFICLFNNKNKGAVPSVSAMGINKLTGKTACSNTISESWLEDLKSELMR